MSRKKRVGSQFGLTAAALLGLCAGSALGQSRAASAVADLRAAYPDAKVLWTGGEDARARMLFGTAMTRGRTPREAAEEFLFLYGEAFSDGPLEVDELHEHPLKRGDVAFGYQQTIDGVPVDGSIIRVLVREDGESDPVVTYASGHFARPPAGGVGAPVVSAPDALGAAMEHPAAAKLFRWTEPALVVTTADGVLSRGDAVLAWKVTGWSDFSETVESFAFWVNAGSGELLRHADMVMRYTPPVSGTVTGGATPGTEPDKPDDEHRCGANPAQAAPLPRLTVEITNAAETQVLASGVTDSNGYYEIFGNNFPSDAKIRFTWDAPAWFMFSEQSITPPDVFSLGTIFPVTHDHNFNPSPFAEFETAKVNAHLGVMKGWEFMHAHLGNGTFAGLDDVVRLGVNDSIFACDARYAEIDPQFGPDILFYGKIHAASCDVNYAYSTAVVHEYGHYLARRMRGIQYVDPHKQFHEGFGDILAMLVYGVAVTGENLKANCDPLRSPLTHTPTPLFDCNLPGAHDGGMLLSSLWLDLADNNALGLAATRQLFVDWMMITAGGIEDGPPGCEEDPKAAGPATLIEVLTVDDDNNTLLDGTPNYNTICRVFEDRLIFMPPSLPSCGDSAGPRPCQANANIDGVLDFFDWLTFHEWFTARDPAADLSGDGVVDMFDLLVFRRLFEEGC